jgi:hypothetical protein
MLSAAALAVSCSGEDPSTGSSTAPITPIGGGAAGAGATTAGGNAAGGTTSGSLAGGTTSGTAVPTLGGGMTAGTPGATAGGTAAGTMTVVEGPCEKKVRTAGKTVPDFMIVLDRSASMRTTVDPNLRCNDPLAFLNLACLGVDCTNPAQMTSTICGGTMAPPGGVDRWAPAVSAIKSLTAMFETKVSFGLTTFPGQGGNGPDANCIAGTLRVPVGLKTAAQIASTLDMTQPAGYTPTSSTLQAVLQHIMGKKTSPDAEVPPQFVLLVTDGEPNCVGQGLENDQQAHQATLAAIDALAKAGVKTFVIGYDAALNMRLADQLTQYAMRGGTNNFFAVTDGPSLVSKFAEITSVVAECTYTLDKAPADKKYVRVELDKEPLKVDDPNGWSIADKTVTIGGTACSKLRDGSKTHTLAVTVECVPVEIN